MKKTIGVLLLALTTLLSLMLYGCSSSAKSPWSSSDADPLSESYQAGYQSGYNSGLLTGELDKQRGRGWNDTVPVPQGDYDNDYMTGFADGYKEGYGKGFNVDPSQDPEYAEGYRDGFNKAAEMGYNDYVDGNVQERDFSYYGNQSSMRYHDGYIKGAEAGYTYGVERAKNGEGMTKDWYGEYLAGEETSSSDEKEWYEDEWDVGEESKFVLDNLGGLYECDAGFDPHYTYHLIISPDYKTYKLSMDVKGGTVLVFREEGTCEFDLGNMTLSLTPDELHKDRPDELPTNPTFKVKAVKPNGTHVIQLIDEDGKIWE
jgi:hypothetical protein